MKNDLRILLILILPLTLLHTSLHAQIIELCSGSTYVMNNEYQVRNNVWGASTAQCLEVDQDKTYFKVSHSEHANTGGEPAAYPFIYKGCHFGGGRTSVDNIMPIMIYDIESAPFTWEIGTDTVSGAWNAAFEAWFDESSIPSSSNYCGELMIWINYYGGKNPGGAKQGSVEIGGHKWDLHYASAENWNGRWNYIAYKITTVTNYIELDLRDFIHDSVIRGYLDDEWYMHNMEAGFEIWRDGQGLTNFFYEATVVEGEYEDVKSHDPIKPAFHLRQNYPNPFNPETEIGYQIGERSHVRLDIYDTLGRKINTLVNQTISPGSYTIQWMGLDSLGNRVPSGVYYYRMIIQSASHEFSDVKKMLLLR